MAKVELRAIDKRYPGGIIALTGLDLTIEHGECLAVVGPSGSGKSTLLRVVAGLESADAGRIRIDDRDANTLPPFARDVAMVFQNATPYPHLSVAANIGFSLRARRVPRKVIAERVREAAALLGLTPLLARKPAALSGGERQRVVLARAVARRPGVMLLDEPLSSLDAPLRTAARADLKELQARLSMTTVFVTHDQTEALALGDRVAVLHRGRLEQCGTAREVYDRPATRFVASFIGNPPMNLLPCEATIEASGARVRLRDFNPEEAFIVPADTRAYQEIAQLGDCRFLLGIRAEHLLIGADSSHRLGPKIRAPVRRVESHGREVWATLAVGVATLTVLLPGSSKVRPGDVLEVMIDPDRISWFHDQPA